MPQALVVGLHGHPRTVCNSYKRHSTNLATSPPWSSAYLVTSTTSKDQIAARRMQENVYSDQECMVRSRQVFARGLCEALCINRNVWWKLQLVEDFVIFFPGSGCLLYFERTVYSTDAFEQQSDLLFYKE